MERFERYAGWFVAAVVAVALGGVPQPGMAQTPAPGLLYGVESGENPPYRLGLGASAGAAHLNESETDGELAGVWNLTGQLLPYQRLMVDLRLGARRYEQQYLSPTVSEGGNARELVAGETRWDGSLNVGYELLSGATDGLAGVAPYAGLQVFGIDNRVFPAWGGAPKLGVVAGIRPVDAFRVEGEVAGALLLFGNVDPGDVMGGARFLWNYNLSALTKMSERISLRFSFVGESLVRERTVRTSLGATVGVDVRLFQRATSGESTDSPEAESASQQDE